MALDASGSAYEFVYDTTAGIPAVMEESTPGGVVYYIREPGGSLIARVKGTDTHYYHFDELGSTRLLTDGSGTVTDRYAYDAYGSLIAHDRYAGSIDQPYQYVGQLGYYTHHQEPEFGPLQLGVRFYDAEVGRFGQRDSEREGLSHCAYVANNPLVYTDPTGRFAIAIGAGVCIGLTELGLSAAAIASILCGVNQECRDQVAQAIETMTKTIADYLDKAKLAWEVCKPRCKVMIHGPHHSWQRTINGKKKKCHMNHVQIICGNALGQTIGPKDGIRMPFGPCYKNKNNMPPGVWK